MYDPRVIAAIASPVGRCARIVLRVSGKGSWEVVRRLDADGELHLRGGAFRARLSVSGMVFPAMVLLFEEGRSYTGEESAELHVPGNPILAKLTLERLNPLGARPAEPGEFTARAFFNGRMDLTEAEGVASAIAATNARELDAARRLQAGELAGQLKPITDGITQMLTLVEAGIDFSEEDIRFLTAEQLRAGAQRGGEQLSELLRRSVRFERLTHEPTIVLCGRPNAGKSTLLNALAGRTRAVVSAAAGTTRDLLSAEVTLERGEVQLVDTAGLEEDTGTNSDVPTEIAAAMRGRALRAVEQADVVMLLKAADDDQPTMKLSREPDLVVLSKSDMTRKAVRDRQGTADVSPEAGTPLRELQVSALNGEGVEELRKRLDEFAFGARGGEELALNVRHVKLIEAAIGELAMLAESPSATDELAAEHLRAAVNALGEITGLVSAEDLLGRIFSTFCIGK